MSGRIELTFVRGGALRRVFIDGRKISLLSAELNFAPLEIDLDKIESNEYQKKFKNARLGVGDIKIIKELAKLNSIEEIIKDITKDFQRSGWRKLGGKN